MGGPVTVPEGRVMWGVSLTAQDATSPHASPLLRSGNSYSGSQSSQSLWHRCHSSGLTIR